MLNEYLLFMSSSAHDAVTKYKRLHGLNNRNLFVTVERLVIPTVRFNQLPW